MENELSKLLNVETSAKVQNVQSYELGTTGGNGTAIQRNVEIGQDVLSNSQKISDEVILQEQLKKIQDTKEANQNDFIDSLKKGLEAEDEYMQKVDAGDLSFIGAETVVATPIADNSDDDEEESTLESSLNMDESDSAQQTPNIAPINIEDFIPEYDKPEEQAETENVEEAKKTKMYENLPICHLDNNQVADAQSFMTKKDSSKFEIIKKEKDSALSDKSFLTALNKVKKSLFSTTTLPLLNSGFFVEVQGGGIMDMLQLYRDKLADTSSMEYDLERLKTFARSIKSTTPNVAPELIISSIHESDYQFLALAYAAATVKTITQPNTCEHCHADFKIEMRPMDSILNMEAINEKVQILRNSEPLTTSLVNTTFEVPTDYGLKVTLGHPTFLDYLKRMESLRQVIENNKEEGYKFASNIKTVSMIRQIELPNGVKTSNAYQIFKAMSLFNEELYDIIDNKILEMQEEVIIPEFGVSEARCPVCGKVNKDIRIGAIDDLVFFHIMVTRI